MITKTDLYLQINEGLSISKLAKQFKCSNSTIRYYLNKYNFKTDITLNRGKKKKCIICENFLTGQQLKYCSNNCKAKGHWLYIKETPNSYHSQTKRGIKRKLAFIKKLGGKCQKCGYNKNISALEFHHIDESTKDISLDIRSFSNHSLEILNTEMLKCELLCSNCHKEYHYPENDYLLLLEKYKGEF